MATRIKHVAALAAGGTPPVDDPDMWDDLGGIPWVSITDITRSSQIAETGRSVSSLGQRTRRLPIGSPGTVLFAMYASVGAIGTLVIDAAWNQALVGIEPRATIADSRFIAYWLEHLRPTLSSLFRTNTQDNLNAEQVGNLAFPEISLDEQRRIADFLDTEAALLDQLILARQAQLSLLPARWRSVLDGVYTTLAERNGVMPLGRHLARIEQGTSPQCDNVEADNDEWGVLKAGAVKGDRFLANENKRLPNNVAAEARYEIHAGDLLITRANTPALVGAAAVVPEGVRSRLILCDKIFRLRLTPGLRPDYVSLLSQASAIRDARAANATGASSSMVNLTNQDVKSWPLPIASPIDQQNVIERLMSARDIQHRLEQAISAQSTLLAERRQALITAAVTGQLDVTTAGGGVQ